LLPPHWQMMGVLQSLEGLLLFGLTTAFMFAMFQALWPSQQQADSSQGSASSWPADPVHREPDPPALSSHRYRHRR
jgi:hypothetical protein